MLARGEEPFHAVMTAAAAVPVGQALRLRAGFEPLPLYDVLAGPRLQSLVSAVRAG